MTTTTTTTEPVTTMEQALERLVALLAEMQATTDPLERAVIATKAQAFFRDEVTPIMAAERLQSVDAMRNAGHSLSQIGKALGLSTSRAYQLVSDPR